MKIFNDKFVQFAGVLFMSIIATVVLLKHIEDETWSAYLLIPLMVGTLTVGIVVYIRQGIKEKKQDKENK